MSSGLEMVGGFIVDVAMALNGNKAMQSIGPGPFVEHVIAYLKAGPGIFRASQLAAVGNLVDDREEVPRLYVLVPCYTCPYCK